MTPIAIATTLAALIASSTVLGLVWKARNGRVRRVSGVISALDLVESPGSVATLLQFSTEVCAPCAATRQVLGAVADSTPGVNHAEIDLSERPDVAVRFSILQTPTTLILDATGAVRSRIGGAVRPGTVREELARIANEPASRSKRTVNSL